jgi:catechol 2,3-dioxygenase-like lactoylglutathione lyase family enzyme
MCVTSDLDRAIPGLERVEHVSTTVPDLDQAVEFFVTVFGASVLRRATFGATPGSDEMATRFNAHPDASAALATLDICGTTLELFEYSAPDLSATMPRNCDLGGHHVGFRVGDVAAAAAYLRTVPGVRVLGDVSYVEEYNGARRGWVYFLTPWGLQLEIADEHPITSSKGA